MTENTKKTTQNQPRPPVIAIMGHIDHGKSTLLDYIRKANVVAGEAGGITQHISAYEVVHKTEAGKEQKITFLDTPGHAAFSAVRERGAQIADIAVLIVSAEEGVKEQTIEAYRSIEQAKTPFIVAINKIDRPNANIERTKQQLAEVGILVEGYGGAVPFVPISAKSGEGVKDLLDMMLLVAEVEELTGDLSAPAEGFVLEANLDPQIGMTATLIIKNGVLHTGDLVAVGTTYAKIKKLENFLGQKTNEAAFSSPVRVYGFSTIPPVGFCFKAFPDKKELDSYLALPDTKSACSFLPSGNANQNTGPTVIPLIVKADVFGSLEAVLKEIVKLGTDKVGLNIVQTGVGTISENDAKAASSSPNSIVLGFHVKTDRSAADLGEKFGFKIMTFDIIYKLSEWLTEEIATRTPKERIEEITGRAKVLKLFAQNRDKQIIGAQVITGVIKKGEEVRIIRRDSEVGRGKALDLQEQKIKMSQVSEG
ncbi:MAG: translation initiation factor IF-2, partial [Candidatus Vogelbacteria bacterium]|nr:translation initiation factor IF-2 [Candidatus Vogelbacteria bacterium]